MKYLLLVTTVLTLCTSAIANIDYKSLPVGAAFLSGQAVCDDLQKNIDLLNKNLGDTIPLELESCQTVKVNDIRKDLVDVRITYSKAVCVSENYKMIQINNFWPKYEDSANLLYKILNDYGISIANISAKDLRLSHDKYEKVKTRNKVFLIPSCLVNN